MFNPAVPPALPYVFAELVLASSEVESLVESVVMLSVFVPGDVPGTQAVSMAAARMSSQPHRRQYQ